MTSFPSLKEPLTLEQLKTFRENFEITFAEELNGPDWHGYYTIYSIPDFGLSWTNETEHNFVKKEFVNYSYTLTGEQDPKKIDQKLLEIEQEMAKNPGQVYRVTPTEEVLERGERLAEEQRIRLAESEAKAKAQTEKFEEPQKKAAAAAKVVSPPAPQVSIPPVQPVQEVPKKVEVPVAAPITASKEEKEKIELKQLVEEEIKPNPASYTNKLAEEIATQGKGVVDKETAKEAASSYVNSLLDLDQKGEDLKDAAKIALVKAPTPKITPETIVAARETIKNQKKLEEFVEQQKKVVEEAKSAQETLKDKKVYVKVVQPEPAKLTADEQKAFNNLRSMAQKTPHILVENITKTIEDKLPEILKESVAPEEIHYYAEAVAVKAVDNLRAGPKPVDKDPVVLASLSNHPEILNKLSVSEADKKFIAKASSDLATLKMLPYRANQQILTSVFGKNVTKQILGPDPTILNVTFTDQPQESTDAVPLDKLAENYQSVSESPFFSQVQSFAVDEVKSKLLDFGKEKVLGQISKLPADSFLGKIAASEKFSGIINLLKPSQTIEATNLFGKLVMNFSPEFAPIVSGIGKLIGVDFGLISVPTVAVVTPAIIPIEAIAIEGVATTTPVVTTAVGGAAKKGIGVAIGTKILTGVASLAAKAGLTGLSTQIGALIGTPFGGFIGAAIGAFIGWVAGKVLKPVLIWIKKHQEDLKILGLVMLGGGALVNSIPVIVIGGLIFVPIALKTGFSMAGIAARTAFLFGRIGRSMAITIGTPIIVAIIVFPILVAIILFIINSGAYIVPPSLPGLNFESPYVGVDKTASPQGPFQNSNLPLTIEYTITITAKKGALTNIHFSESCQVIKKGASVSCPSITGGIPQPPESISPTTPFSFKYSVTYTAGTFADSLVVNSFTVTADATGVSGVKGVGSTSIRIGNPPEDCPNNAWPIDGNGGLNAVVQGPSAPGCTHQNLNNAIDIGVDGATVVAVHSGIVTVGEDSCTGKTIKISSTCGSVPFSSFYAHLGAVTVSTGQKVSVGQAIGISDNTGSCTSGPHLHFSFQTSSIPKVQKPYLIRDIPIGCCTISTCNP